MRREAAAAMIATKPASELFYESALWYLVWVCGSVVFFSGEMSDAMG